MLLKSPAKAALAFLVAGWAISGMAVLPVAHASGQGDDYRRFARKVYLDRLLQESRTFSERESSPVLFTGRDDVLGRVLLEIESARSRIDVAFFSIKSEPVIDALIKKAREGVTVQILDGASQSASNVYLRQRLESEAPERLIYYSVPNFRGGYFHHKALIIDSTKAWIGSANLSQYGLIGSLDYLVSFSDDRIVRPVMSEFSEVKLMAENFCRALATQSDQCGRKSVRYPVDIYRMFFSRVPSPGLFHDRPECRHLKRLDSVWFLSPASLINQSVLDCLNNSSLAGVIRSASYAERFVDGSSTSSVRPYWRKGDTQSGQANRIYFSPEDNPSKRITDHLYRLGQNRRSKVLVSTGILTEEHVRDALLRLRDRGLDVRFLFDEHRYFSSDFSAHRSFDRLGARVSDRSSSDPARLAFVKNPLGGDHAYSHHRFILTLDATRNEITLITGSANFSENAFKNSDEFVFMTRDKAIVRSFLNEYLSLSLRHGFANSPWNPEFRQLVREVSSLFQSAYREPLRVGPKHISIAMDHGRLKQDRADLFLYHPLVGVVRGRSMTPTKTVFSVSMSHKVFERFILSPELSFGVGSRLLKKPFWKKLVKLDPDAMKHPYTSYLHIDWSAQP